MSEPVPADSRPADEVGPEEPVVVNQPNPSGRKAEALLNEWLRRHGAAILLGVVVLLTFAIRIRLLDMPLERDEGEYAYAGQLILQGIPPYKLACNMKLPGTYAAYALIMAVFGQTRSAIHFGVALVNVMSIVMMFLFTRKLLDEVAAITAAGIFGLMALTPSVLGLAGHATHFVVFCALGGLLLLFRAMDRPSSRTLFLSGLCFGLAFLMKQHGILFGAFAGFYWWWTRIQQSSQTRTAPSYERSRHGRRRRSAVNVPWRPLLIESAWLAGGMVLPYAITCLVLWNAGVFRDFVFWTFSYASKYVSAMSFSNGLVNLRVVMGRMLADNPYFWILALAGCFFLWWDDRVRSKRLFLIGFTFCSIVAVSAGLYFRPHYFILLLPALALMAGAAMSRAAYLLKRDRSLELLLAVPLIVLVLVGLGAAFANWGSVWFSMSPRDACTRCYGSTLFAETVDAAEYIKSNASKNARVIVLGSEPQIYFYSHRYSGTGYIYAYPLMETHPYASQMQAEFIEQIKSVQPEYIVFVKHRYSWMAQANSDHRLLSWWGTNWTTFYNLERTFTVKVDPQTDLKQLLLEQEKGPLDVEPTEDSYLLVLRRKS